MKIKQKRDLVLKKIKGFTLIELLVVIAIIGILSSVVLSSLNTARAKGRDAKAKSELNSIRSQASLYYDDNNQTYGGDGIACNTIDTLFDPAGTNNVNGLITDAEAAVNTSAVCANSSSAYVVGLPLSSGDNWCIDSTGFSGITSLALGDPGIQANIACQ